MATEATNAPATEATHEPVEVDGEGAPVSASSSSAVKHQSNAIQVSLDKAPTFYARIGRRMFSGSVDTPAFEEVIVTGLGNATNIAIGTASIMEREEVASITKVETAYFTSARAKKRLPKITISLVRNPNFKPDAPRESTEGHNEPNHVVAPDASAPAVTAAA